MEMYLELEITNYCKNFLIIWCLKILKKLITKDKLKIIFTPSFLYKLKNPFKSRLNLSGSKKYFLSKMLLKTSW